MKKKYLFLFIILITVACIFTAAATCSLCSLTIEREPEEYKEIDQGQDENVKENIGGQEVNEGPEEDETEDTDFADDDEQVATEEDQTDETESEEPETGDTEEETEEDSGEAIEEGLQSFIAETSVSGHICEDGTVFIAADSAGTPSVYVGDTATNQTIYGFFSFDLRDIAGKEVLNAWLNLRPEKTGDPGSFMGNIFIESVNYGNSLDSGDFDISGQGLYSFRPGFNDFSFSNEHLKNAVQNALTAEKQYFQIKVGVHLPSTNRSSDGFTFLIPGVSLEVSYY